MIDQSQAILCNNSALEMLSEARRILEDVVTSSESFDYPKAKNGIKRLNRMIRDLAREEARLRNSTEETEGNTRSKVVTFPINPGPA
jgi:hypothetical protein